MIIALKYGLLGLNDKPRCSHPLTISVEFVQQVMSQLLQGSR